MAASSAATSVERVLSVFDAYIDHANADHGGGFRGCGLLNTAAEFPAGAPERDAVRLHKEQVEQILAEGLAELTDGDRPAYVYFNNDNHGHAAFNALTLRRMAETEA